MTLMMITCGKCKKQYNVHARECPRCREKVNGMSELKKRLQEIIDAPGEPALVFISPRGLGNEDETYVKGEKVIGERRIAIHSDYESATTHEIDYLTAAFREEPKK
jgi:hypothetical protein